MKTSEIKWTHEQCKQIVSTYDEIPDPPKGYEFTGRIIQGPVEGDQWLGHCGTTHKFRANAGHGNTPVIEVEELPKRYRYICDNPELRRVKRGDWVACIAPGTLDKEASRFVEAGNDWPAGRAIVFRREEIADE